MSYQPHWFQRWFGSVVSTVDQWLQRFYYHLHCSFKNFNFLCFDCQITFYFSRRQFLPSKPIIHLWNRDANLYLPFRTPQCDLFCLNIFIFIYVSYSVGLNELLCMWWRNHRTVSSSTIRSNIRFQSSSASASPASLCQLLLLHCTDNVALHVRFISL